MYKIFRPNYNVLRFNKDCMPRPFEATERFFLHSPGFVMSPGREKVIRTSSGIADTMKDIVIVLYVLNSVLHIVEHPPKPHLLRLFIGKGI